MFTLFSTIVIIISVFIYFRNRLHRQRLRSYVNTNNYDSSHGYVCRYNLKDQKLLNIRIQDNRNKLLKEIVCQNDSFQKQLMFEGIPNNDETAINIFDPVNTIQLDMATVISPNDLTNTYLDRSQVSNVLTEHSIDFTKIESFKSTFVLKEQLIGGEIYLCGHKNNGQIVAKIISNDLEKLINHVTNYKRSLIASLIGIATGIIILII